MNTTTLILELPELNDETATKMHTFFYDLAATFETQYYAQIKRYYKKYLQEYDIEPVKAEIVDINFDSNTNPF